MLAECSSLRMKPRHSAISAALAAALGAGWNYGLASTAGQTALANFPTNSWNLDTNRSRQARPWYTQTSLAGPWVRPIRNPADRLHLCKSFHLSAAETVS